MGGRNREGTTYSETAWHVYTVMGVTQRGGVTDAGEKRKGHS